jgi:hypothetical protein
MQTKCLDNTPYKSNGKNLNTNSKIDYDRIHFLEDEFYRLPKGSAEREQNINERLKLLGINTE